MTRAALRLALALALICLAAKSARADDLDPKLARVETTGSIGDFGELTNSDVPTLRAKLESLSKRGTEDGIASALSATRTANASRFWADDFDLLKALIASGPLPMTDDYRIAIEFEAILAALQHVATTSAIAAMIDSSGAHRAQFRFDIGRRIRAVGDRALAPLILAKGGPSVELRHWAGTELEAMGKRVAGDAVQTKSDDVLVEVLGAFGTVHDRDALPVVVAFTSSERKRIREAARASTLAYDKDALPKLREIYGNLMGHPPLDEATADAVAHDIFAFQDKQRMADLDAIVDDGLKKQAAGDSSGAVEQFDRALAREPTLDRRKEMVPAFVTRGDSLVDTDPLAARHAYQEALSLDPDTPRKGMIQGALALLDAQALHAKGIDDKASYERVLDLDPGNIKALAALDAMESAKSERDSRANHYAWALAGALVIICASVLLGLRGKRVSQNESGDTP